MNVRRLLPIAPLLLLAACASDGYDSVGEYRSEAIRPTRSDPDGLVEMREDMTEMREETLTRLDEVMGGAPADATPWYGPMFDALDFAVSIGHLLY